MYSCACLRKVLHGRLSGLGQSVAFEEGVELVLDEARQIRSGAGLGVSEEAGGVLLHKAVQRSLLGAMAFVVERGAIGSPLGLRRGLHEGLPRVESPHGLKLCFAHQSP
jgi:hypothetical protein